LAQNALDGLLLNVSAETEDDPGANQFDHEQDKQRSSVLDQQEGKHHVRKTCGQWLDSQRVGNRDMPTARKSTKRLCLTYAVEQRIRLLDGAAASHKRDHERDNANEDEQDCGALGHLGYCLVEAILADTGEQD